MARGVIRKSQSGQFNMSYEPGRKVAYSVDLRHRMIWQRFAMEEQFRSIAQNLGVSVGTVYNICKIFERTGCVDASKPDLNRLECSLHIMSKSLLACCLKIPAYNYLGEICSILPVSKSRHPQFAVSSRDMGLHGKRYK